MKIRIWYVKYQSTDVTHSHIKVDLFQISFDVLEQGANIGMSDS